MRIKQNQGRVVHQALSFVFQILPQGGSLLQKYDAPSQSYIPNRAATPLVLKPILLVEDPDGLIPYGDYTSQLSNVTWTLMLTVNGTTAALPATNGADTNYTVNSDTKVLTLSYNVQPANILNVKFSAYYTDTRRGEVHHFEWSRDLNTEEQTDLNVSLDTGKWKGSVQLMPFKNWGQFGIPVQLKNGADDIPDANCNYQWQWWNGTTFSADFSECPWLVSGEQTKEIVVDQDYIENLVLRCKAYAYNDQHTTQYFVTRLRRWYGQFDYDVELPKGKYIFQDTNLVALEAWVANASRGIISNPCKYFDIELFFTVGSQPFEHVGYGTEAIVKRSDLHNGDPKAGVLVREKTAYRALTLPDGSVLCEDDGTPIFVQVPTKTREV